jgi:BlaI family penicillinase repressor
MASQTRKGPGRLPKLTPLELKLMQVFWARGDATTAEVRKALQKEHPMAATTVHTLVTKLREKGYIEPIPTVERSVRFAPRVERAQVARRSLRELLDAFFGGSPKSLMAHLLKEESLDEAEMAQIRKMLRSSKKHGDKRK